MSDRFSALRIELLRPSQIRSAIALSPIVYVPIGTYEYHQEHLPIGLDALTSQGVCLDAAQLTGGLVCPPLYYGTGGDHAELPFTIMMPQAEQIEGCLDVTLQRLKSFGARVVVLLSGHFADEQVAMVKTMAARWSETPSKFQVLGLAMNMAKDQIYKPDHAGMFETTLLAAFHPELVDISELPPLQPEVDVDAGRSPYGKQRLDPAHPLWGIFGPDPRHFDPQKCDELRLGMLRWLSKTVNDARATLA